MFLKHTVLALSIFASSSLFAMENGALEYYRDGVYDTTSQINKHLREGLQEQVMDHFVGKHLVMIDLEKFSTVDILFFETIAEKNHIMDVVVVKNIKNNKSYMVFGGYEREADANMIANKLVDSGVDASVSFNKETYVKNPIVVKKFLGDIREMIKDMPVKVVKIEKTIAKDGTASCQQQLPVLPPVGMGRTPSQYEIQTEFDDIDKRWKKGGVVASTRNYVAMPNSKIGKVSFHGIDEKVGCFQLKDIVHNNYACTDSIILVAPNGEKMTSTRVGNCGVKKSPVKSAPKKVVKKITAKKVVSTGTSSNRNEYCPDEDVSSTSVTVAQPQSQPSPQKAQASENVAYCDFNKIAFGTIAGKNTKISATPYAGKQINVSVTKGDGAFTLKASGMPAISVRDKLYSNGCSQ